MDVNVLPHGVVGAQKLPDLDFDSKVSTDVRHVGKSAPSSKDPDDDQNPGTAAEPWKTIGHALKCATQGQTILIHEGVYKEDQFNFIKSGAREAPIRILAAPGETVIIKGPKLNSENEPFTGPLLDLVDVRYWIIEGLEVALEGRSSAAIRLACASHIVLRDLKVHGGTAGSGVYMRKSEDVALFSSEIHDFSQGAVDSHAVVVKSDCKVVLIKDVTAHGNSGDAVQLVGPDSDSKGNSDSEDDSDSRCDPKPIADPEDVTIEDNYFYRNGENGVDLKSCTRVTVRGNRMFGYQPKASAPQGDALVVQRNAKSVLIEHNRIWDCGRGMSLGSNDLFLGPVVVRRNLIYDVKAKGGQSKGDGIRARRAEKVEIYHNTLYNIEGRGVVLGGDGSSNMRCVFVNNIVVGTQTAVDLRSGLRDLAIDRNLYFNENEDEVKFKSERDVRKVPLDKWRDAGYDRTSLNEDPCFVENPRHNDFHLEQCSPARNQAIDIGDPLCSGSCDLGFLETRA